MSRVDDFKPSYLSENKRGNSQRRKVLYVSGIITLLLLAGLTAFLVVYFLPKSSSDNSNILVPDKPYDYKDDQFAFSGLSNLGNTCFMNAMLQSLYATQSLRNDFFNNEHEKFAVGLPGDNPQMKQCRVIVQELGNLFKLMKTSAPGPLSPSSLRTALGARNAMFTNGNQHDSAEAFVSVMECISMVKNSANGGLASAASYRFRVSTKQICRTNSNHTSIKVDPSELLNLPMVVGGTRKLTDLIKNTMKSPLTGDDQWYCPVCKKLVDADREITYLDAPNFLFVTLGRFGYDEVTHTAFKIQDFVDFPLSSLDLSPYFKDATSLYDLYAVVIHTGAEDTQGGHYYAYAKNYDGKWFSLNDSTVSEISDTTVKNEENAYILAFRKRPS